MPETFAQACAQTFAKRFPNFCQLRDEQSHKGDYGHVFAIGGAEGMTGAIVLAASAALLMGCGKSHAIFCQTQLPLPMLPHYPEVMLATPSTMPDCKAADSIVIGCGMGSNPQIHRLGRQILHQILQLSRQDDDLPSLIIDADALNLIAADPQLQACLFHYQGIKILTPHPLEAARLLNSDSAWVQNHRLSTAQKLAKQFDAHVVLKGNRSLIVSPKGECIENSSGNAGLASAGTGDVLSGMIGSFVAQQRKCQSVETALIQALSAAVFLHGAAAEVLGEGLALSGLLAGEVAPMARHIRHLATRFYADKA